MLELRSVVGNKWLNETTEVLTDVKHHQGTGKFIDSLVRFIDNVYSNRVVRQHCSLFRD